MRKTYLQRLLKRGQTGQAVVILAFGFIALIGFVGITVDVSLLFVRYSTLRRAVDSATIAAAGQMRQDRNLGEVHMAALQFIEFHNLNPRRVVVHTCANSPDVDPDTPGLQEDPEVCTADQRKLVRVTAEIDSPTVFMRLFGFDDIALSASAISETAVLDVIIMMDVSESMLLETTYDDWARVNQGIAYVPPITHRNDEYGLVASPTTIYGRELLAFNDTGGASGYDPADFSAFYYEFWARDMLGVPQAEVNSRLWYNTTAPPADIADDQPSVPLPAGENDTDAGANPNYNVDFFVPQSVQNNSANGLNQMHPRPECRVRFHPYSKSLPRPDYIQDLYSDPEHNIEFVSDDGGGDNWAGFVPTYNFYGCCNDPGNGTLAADGITIIPGASTDADNNFSDLVCQPFKDARDATRLFLDRIDFVRGDRVGFVTFDRTAFIIDPDGDPRDTDLDGAADAGLATHMIENFSQAVDTLNRVIGVRADPNFYVWDRSVGNWTSYARGVDDTGNSVPIDYNSVAPEAATYNDYPVANHCPYQNAALDWPFSIYATRSGFPTGTGTPALQNIMTPDIFTDAPWVNTNNALKGLGQPGLTILNSYELWASCRGTNIGAALREANNALTDPTTERREGTVWVMVMLSDGAAGASDPARRFGQIPVAPQPYTPNADHDPVNNVYSYGLRGEYGSLGLCPYGSPSTSNLGELTDTADEDPLGFPYCLDEQPETRHFCYPRVRAQQGGDSSVGGPTEYGIGFGPGARDRNYNYSLSEEQNAAAGRFYDIDVGNYPEGFEGYGTVTTSCDLFYDVDDYARDWADFVGQIGVAEANPEALPTIFTIAFGLDYADRSDPNRLCENNIQDCLGEELLRYIADVGDNFEIDTDYQQDYLHPEPGTANYALDDSLGGAYGAPGPCETIGFGPNGGGYDWTTGEVRLGLFGENCGNYFNAPGAAELQVVFDEIASRMFTRLAG